MNVLYYLTLKYLVMFFFLFVSLTVLQMELYILYYVPRHGALAPRVGPFILENKKNKKTCYSIIVFLQGLTRDFGLDPRVKRYHRSFIETLLSTGPFPLSHFFILPSQCWQMSSTICSRSIDSWATKVTSKPSGDGSYS